MASLKKRHHGKSSPGLLSRYELLCLRQQPFNQVSQGEENIASAVINTEGSLLAVSTIAQCKLFALRPSKSSAGDLRIRKVQMPVSLSSIGARLLQFSPDSRWLLAITDANLPCVHRIMKDTVGKTGIRIMESPVQLKRRDHSSSAIKQRYGTHGDYDRTIIRAAWSSDSRILAVGDVGGCLEAWALEGHEDLLQPGNEQTSAETDDNTIIPDSQSIASGDGMSDVANGGSTEVIFGQHWTQLGKRIPRLPSMPLLLSFRPADKRNASRVENNIAVHPTRHNPSPYSHSLPTGEDRLVVVSSENHLYEYHIMKGEISPWSRRNPSTKLPQAFRDIRDRAMGCIWDLSNQRQRLWLYGNSWLWMFNIAQDLPDPEDSTKQREGSQQESLVSLKRKRESSMDAIERKELMKHTSGAGSKVPLNKIRQGIGDGLTKTVGTESTWIRLEDGHPRSDSRHDSDEDMVSDEEHESDLLRLRRLAQTNGTQSHPAVANDTAQSKGDEDGMEPRAQPSFWKTFQYRPILGIVRMKDPSKESESALSTTTGKAREGMGNPEVAIVERPLWEADLPAAWEDGEAK